MHALNRDLRPGTTLSRELLAVLTLVITLLAFAIWRFPESATHGASLNLVLTAAGILTFACIAVWTMRTSFPGVCIALHIGAKAVLVLGAVEILNHWLEFHATLRPPLPAILGVSMWGLLFFCFGAAGSAASLKTGSIRLGALAGVWSAILSTAALLLFGIVTALIFLERTKFVLAGDFASSGMTDPNAFVIRNLIDSAASHLLIAPIVAAVAAIVSSVIADALRALNRRTQVLLAVGGVLLLASGVASIRFASSLERSARGPYILSGLMALFLSLAAAYPLASAMRNSASLQPPEKTA